MDDDDDGSAVTPRSDWRDRHVENMLAEKGEGVHGDGGGEERV